MISSTPPPASGLLPRAVTTRAVIGGFGPMSADVPGDVTFGEFVREGADVGGLKRDKKQDKRLPLQAELLLTVRIKLSYRCLAD